MFGKKKTKNKDERSLVMRSNSLPVPADPDAAERIRKTDGVLSAFFERKKIERAITIGKLEVDRAKQMVEFEKTKHEYATQRGRREHIPLILDKEAETHLAEAEEARLRKVRAQAQRKAIENPPPPPQLPLPAPKPNPYDQAVDRVERKFREAARETRTKAKLEQIFRHAAEIEALRIEDRDPEGAAGIRHMAEEAIADLNTGEGDIIP